MERKHLWTRGMKFSIDENGKEVAHAYLYFIQNDLHKRPFGLMEDVYVDENSRSKGYGTQLVQTVIAEAKQEGCYKLIATSRMERPKVHALYQRLGFESHGLEFRMNLS